MKALFVMLTFALIMFAGCSPVQRMTVVEEKILEITPPEITEVEIPAVEIGDSLITGYVVKEDSINPGKADTIATVTYYPKKKTFDLQVKPPKVEHIYRDTTELVTYKEPEKPAEEDFFESWKFLTISALFILGIIYIIFNRRR